MVLSFLQRKETNQVPNTRSQRVKCWESRDQFFACLDKIQVIDSLSPVNQDKVKKNCSEEFNNFNKECINSWIQYFQKKRITDWEKSQYVMSIEKDSNNETTTTKE